MRFFLENKKYFFLDLWIINKFYCGYFKKFVYNDILFSYMYKYMLNGIGESLF